jgi:hypothetical protein
MALAASWIWTVGLMAAAPANDFAALDAQLQAALRAGDASTLSAMLDGQALALATLPRPDAPRLLFEALGTAPARACADLLLRSLPRREAEALTLRRVLDRPAPDGAVLRYVVERDQGLSQILSFQVSTLRGAPLVVDAEASLEGHRCSVSILRQALTARPALASALEGPARTWAQHLDALARAQAARRHGRGLEAIRRYEALPAPAQADPELAMTTLWAAIPLRDERPFLALQSILLERFPDDPGILLRLQDHHALRRDPSGPPAALEAVTALSRLLGPDPALDELRCVYGRPGLIDARELEKVAQRALQQDPTRLRARITLFNLKMDKGDLTSAVKQLNDLRRALPREAYASLLVEHPDLLQSVEYRHWQKFLAER